MMNGFNPLTDGNRESFIHGGRAERSPTTSIKPQ